MTTENEAEDPLNLCVEDQKAFEDLVNAEITARREIVDLLAWVISGLDGDLRDKGTWPELPTAHAWFREPLFYWLAFRDPAIDRLARAIAASWLTDGDGLTSGEAAFIADLLLKDRPARRSKQGDNLARDVLLCMWLRFEDGSPSVPPKTECPAGPTEGTNFAAFAWTASAVARSEFLEQKLMQHFRFANQAEFPISAETIRSVWRRKSTILQALPPVGTWGGEVSDERALVGPD